jgi:hypothetical protein
MNSMLYAVASTVGEVSCRASAAVMHVHLHMQRLRPHPWSTCPASLVIVCNAIAAVAVALLDDSHKLCCCACVLPVVDCSTRCRGRPSCN